MNKTAPEIQLMLPKNIGLKLYRDLQYFIDYIKKNISNLYKSILRLP